MKLLAPVFSVASLVLFSLPALAATPVGQVPEPGALALLGIGAGAAAAIVWARKRNKK